jgi:hypothetical protein
MYAEGDVTVDSDDDSCVSCVCGVHGDDDVWQLRCMRLWVGRSSNIGSCAFKSMIYKNLTIKRQWMVMEV